MAYPSHHAGDLKTVMEDIDIETAAVSRQVNPCQHIQNENGYDDIMAIAVASPKDLADISGIAEGAAVNPLW